MPAAPIDTARFFNRDARVVAADLLGKLLCHCVQDLWLCAVVIEAEAYLLEERASHASLGYTEKRRALFMAPGTIYMYYARGGDSFNVSCRGEGNAVLVKAALPLPLHPAGAQAGSGPPLRAQAEPMLRAMRARNPLPGDRPRPDARLCGGQTLLCRALGLKVGEWDARPFDGQRLTLMDTGYRPRATIRTTRLGIPAGRDEHLPYRFVDYDHARHCTRNPLAGRNGTGAAYVDIIPNPDPHVPALDAEAAAGPPAAPRGVAIPPLE
ncbi:MAG: DNA-3-methyladenine glycosylase [Candidatus Lambdaproteobacteria bacterium]|nr:DNA-3-methyladenine glycosylase [Candidatus Lambdaproteobacteria bacterium]